MNEKIFKNDLNLYYHIKKKSFNPKIFKDLIYRKKLKELLS